MSLFLADLSFDGTLYDQARLGIIVGSLVSAGLGIALLSRDCATPRIRYDVLALEVFCSPLCYSSGLANV